MKKWKPIGEPLTSQRLAEIERELNVKLPPDYSRFALRHNGASSMQPLDIVIDDEPRGVLRVLFALTEPVERPPGEEVTVQEVRQHFSDPDWKLPGFLLPIAATHENSLVLLSTAEEAFGHVYMAHMHEGVRAIGDYADGSMAKYYKPGQHVPTVFEVIEEQYKIADSFTEFLELLAPGEE